MPTFTLEFRLSSQDRVCICVLGQGFEVNIERRCCNCLNVEFQLASANITDLNYYCAVAQLFSVSVPGCMRDLRLNGRSMPLDAQSKDSVLVLSTVGVTLGCSSDSCRRNQCSPPFTCVDLWRIHECRYTLTIVRSAWQTASTVSVFIPNPMVTPASNKLFSCWYVASHIFFNSCKKKVVTTYHLVTLTN